MGGIQKDFKVISIAILLFVLLASSFSSMSQSLAALRVCTGQEVATAYSYKAQIEVEKFYSKTTNSANLAGLSQKLQNLLSTCDTDGFKAGNPTSKTPNCNTSEINLLINFRTAYAQQVNDEADNSDEITRLRNSYNNFISTGRTQLAVETNIKISSLIQEIQHHYLMQIYFKKGFEALSSTCKNSGVSLPKRALDNPPTNPSSVGPASLANYLQRFLGYRSGDLLPQSITGIECGPSSKGEVFTKTRDSSGDWVTLKKTWAGNYDLGSKYAVQTATVPVNPIHVTLNNGDWQGVLWPYTTQKVFTLERCDSGNSKKNAVRNYSISDLVGKNSIWARQAISNLNPLVYEGSPNYYRIEDLGVKDLSIPEWNCAIKKSITSTEKKNGKSVKITKPAVSDFKVNITSDGSVLTIWECDDLKLGQFIEVQKISLSQAWDLSARDANNNFLWVMAMFDPRHPNWTWACPDIKGERTCSLVSSIS
jgi:hypothetical protein